MLAVCCSLALGLAPTPTSTEEVHPERQAQLAAIRAASPKWHAAPHPRFAAEAPGASKPLMGVQGDWKADMEALILQGEVHRYESSSLLTAQDIPESFDSETNWPQCADIIGEPSTRLLLRAHCMRFSLLRRCSLPSGVRRSLKRRHDPRPIALRLLLGLCGSRGGIRSSVHRYERLRHGPHLDRGCLLLLFPQRLRRRHDLASLAVYQVPRCRERRVV